MPRERRTLVCLVFGLSGNAWERRTLAWQGFCKNKRSFAQRTQRTRRKEAFPSAASRRKRPFFSRRRDTSTSWRHKENKKGGSRGPKRASRRKRSFFLRRHDAPTSSRRKENKRGIAGSRWLPRDYPKALLLPLFPFKHVHPTRYEELFCGYGVPVLRVRCE